MSEFTGDFPEELFGFVETELSGEYEAAMEDMRVKRAVEGARAIERRVNAGEEFDVEQEIQQLDTEVVHVLGQECDLTGYVTVLTPDGDIVDERRYVDNLKILFGGFSLLPSLTEEGVMKAAFALKTFMDGEDMITRSKIAELEAETSPTVGRRTIEVSTHPAVAFLEDVSIDFKIASPDRAMAWLTVMYPDTLAELDRLLLPMELDYDVYDITDDEALHRLRDFQLERPDGMSDAGWMQYKSAVAQYALNLSVIDPQMPYYAEIKGPNRVLSPETNDFIVRYTEQSPVWLIAEKLALSDVSNYTVGDDATEDAPEIAVFAISGIVASDDIYEKPQSVMVPFSSLQTFKSLRNMDVRL